MSALPPLVALAGPTASGKSALAIALALRFGGEIVSCDSVAVYRGMELGTAKPSAAERALVPHHCLDLYDPTEPCTAGDWARHARESIVGIHRRGRLPIVAGGTGLYLRALLDGLHPAPQADEPLRALLRSRMGRRAGPHLHRTLLRLDPVAAARIHANDAPKLIRAIEVSLAARRAGKGSMTATWEEPNRDALSGFRVLRLTLVPPREELYRRINHRAAEMFRRGLVQETRMLIERYGPDCRPFGSLGYAEAGPVVRGERTEAEAIAAAQQGHRNYSKRQGTWFRREAELHPTQVLEGFGDAEYVIESAAAIVAQSREPAKAGYGEHSSPSGHLPCEKNRSS